LPCGKSVVAQVACNLPPANGSKYWLVGIGWEAPGNLWCLAPTPSDWENYAEAPRYLPASLYSSRSDRESRESRRCH
jgi:hypothetical protein